MAPKDLAEEGDGAQKEEFLKVDDLAERVTEMEARDHFTQDDNRGDQECRPLKSEEKGF